VGKQAEDESGEREDPVVGVESVPETVDLLGWAWLVSLPAVALSFAAGLVNRVYVASALQHLTVRLRARATPGELRGHLADALEDPSLRVGYWKPGEPG
jgi:hypothetical protein